MAKMKITGFSDMLKAFDSLAEITKASIKAVDQAAPVLEKSLKNQISAKADKGYGKGELARSVIARKAKENEYGVYTVIGPAGTDSKGVSNAKKLALLEYGVSEKHQEPRPVRQPAVDAARKQCEELMEKAIEDFVDKNW